MSALIERAAQFVGLPAGARAQDGNVHRSRSRLKPASYDRSISLEQRSSQHVGVEPPAWNVRPLVALVSHTSAGLKSIGSIL